MGFYSPRVLLNEARRVGIAILPPDIHLSGEGCTVETFEKRGAAIRVGLSYCKGLSQRSIEAIIEERKERPFYSIAELYHRTTVDSRVLSNLIHGGFLDTLAGESKTGGRRALLDTDARLPRNPKKGYSDRQRELTAARRIGVGSNMEAGWWSERPEPGRISRLPFPPGEDARLQREVLFLDVEEHPLHSYREALKELKVTPAKKIREMPTGSRVRAAGLMERLQSPPTKSGKVVYFLLIEDETGLLQATIFSGVHQCYGHHLYRAGAFLLEGTVEQDPKRGFSFVADRIQDLTPLLNGSMQPASANPGSGAMLRTSSPSTDPRRRSRAS